MIKVLTVLSQLLLVGLFFVPQFLFGGLSGYANSTIYISEVYYQRTEISGFDKWIEIYNPTDRDIQLADYSLLIGKSGYIYNFKSNFIPANDYIIIQNSRSDMVGLLGQNNEIIDEYSGRISWISNTTGASNHITLSLLNNGQNVQTISYNHAQTQQLLAASNTSLTCTIYSCEPTTTTKFGYNISPRSTYNPIVIDTPTVTPIDEPIPTIIPQLQTPDKPTPQSNPAPFTTPLQVPVLAPITQPASTPVVVPEVITNPTPALSPIDVVVESNPINVTLPELSIELDFSSTAAPLELPLYKEYILTQITVPPIVVIHEIITVAILAYVGYILLKQSISYISNSIFLLDAILTNIQPQATLVL